MKDNSVYKQTTSQGCLPVCLLILSNNKITENIEMNLVIEGLKRKEPKEIPYAIKICEQFSLQYRRNLTIYIDNKFYLKYLNEINKLDSIKLMHKYINKDTIDDTSTPFILYIDNNILGNYTHDPHFIIIEKSNNTSFTIIDPWVGKRLEISKKVILPGVKLLKKQFRYSPLIIKLD